MISPSCTTGSYPFVVGRQRLSVASLETCMQLQAPKAHLSSPFLIVCCLCISFVEALTQIRGCVDFYTCAPVLYSQEGFTNWATSQVGSTLSFPAGIARTRPSPFPSHTVLTRYWALQGLTRRAANLRRRRKQLRTLPKSDSGVSTCRRQ